MPMKQMFVTHKGSVPNAGRMGSEELYNLAIKYYTGTGISRDLKRAAEILQYLVDKARYAPAIFRLGLCYEVGYGVHKDEKRAVSLYEQAAKRGDARAITHLGTCYEKGACGLQQDKRRAATLYSQAAELNYDAAQYELGRCYEEGIGLEKDEHRAIQLYQSAFERGYSEGHGRLGQCYENGIGIGKDQKRAADLYLSVVLQHGPAEPVAKYNLGRCYKFGIGVGKNEERAVKLFQEAADQGIAEAELQLGECYANGCGHSKDEKKAVAAYRRAADQGLASGQFNLAQCFERGRGVPKDEKRAAALYQQAADQGLPEAQCNLGSCYAFGRGVARDEKRAAELYRQAADRGIAEAISSLGYHYAYGLGLDKDEKKAAELYQQAAHKDDAGAQCSLGDCYERGIGVEKDEQRSVKLYQQAVDQGLPEAQFKLGCCYEKGIGGLEKNERQAVSFYQKAAQHDVAEAQYYLGWCYEKGTGVEENEKRAIELYQSAVHQISKQVRISPKNSFELLTKIVSRKALPDAQFELYNYYVKHIFQNESNNEKALAEAQQTAFVWCEKAANQGYLPAMYELSLCYFKGQGVASDFKKGRRLLEEAAQKDFTEAHLLLGQCYLTKKFGFEHNEALAVQSWEKAAKQGSLKAIHLLSDMYANQDPVKALKYRDMGVELGDPLCLTAAALLYSEGKGGIPQDKKRAAEYLCRAAEKEDAHAQYLLAQRFASGEGVPYSEDLTIFWLKKAVENGHAKAGFLLGTIFKCHNKLKESKTYFEIAAKMNHVDAQFELGGLLIQEGEFENGRKWFEAAAKEGHFKAQFAMAEQHLVLYRDNTKALEYLQMVINNTLDKTEEDKLRLFNAHFLIGKILCTQEPPLRDIKRGLEHIEIAAKEKSSQALWFLGHHSLIKNPKEAILPYHPQQGERYLNELVNIKLPHSDLNIDQAHWFLYELYRTGAEGVEPNLEKANQHLNAIAKTPFTELHYYLGLEHYKKGNLILARDYLSRSVNSGEKAAESILAEVLHKIKREKRLFGVQNEGELKKQKEEHTQEQQEPGTKRQSFSERFSELKAFVESKNEEETYDLYFRDWEIKRYDLPHYLKDLRKVTVKKTEEIKLLLTPQVLLEIEHTKKIPEAMLKRLLENSLEYFNYLKTSFQKDKDQLITKLVTLERNYTEAVEKLKCLGTIDEIWGCFGKIKADLKISQENLLNNCYQPMRRGHIIQAKINDHRGRNNAMVVSLEEAHKQFLEYLKNIKHVEEAFYPTLERNSPAIHAALEVDQLAPATQQFEEINVLWLTYEENMKRLLDLKNRLQEMKKRAEEQVAEENASYVEPKKVVSLGASRKTKPSKKQIQTEQAVRAAQKRAKDQKIKSEDRNREEARNEWKIKFEKLKQAHLLQFSAQQQAQSLQAQRDREREKKRTSPPSLSAPEPYSVPRAKPLTFNQRSHLNERLNFREEAKNLQELIRSCSEAREKSVISSDAKLGKEEAKIRAEVNVNQYALLGGITRLLEMSSKSSLFPIQAMLARRIRNHLYHSLKSTLIQSKGEGTEFSVLLEFSAHLASFCAGYIPEKSAQLTFANLSQQLNSSILKGFIINLLEAPKAGSFEGYLNETRSLAEDYEKFNQVNVNPTPSPAPPTPEMEEGRIRREREARYYLVSRLHANVTALELRLRLFKSKSDPTKTGKEWIAKELVSLEFKKQAKILIEKYKVDLATKAKAYRHKAPYEARRSEFQEFGLAFIATERKERADDFTSRAPHSCMPGMPGPQPPAAMPGPMPHPNGTEELPSSYAAALVFGRPAPPLPDIRCELQFPRPPKTQG